MKNAIALLRRASDVARNNSEVAAAEKRAQDMEDETKLEVEFDNARIVLELVMAAGVPAANPHGTAMLQYALDACLHLNPWTKWEMLLFLLTIQVIKASTKMFLNLKTTVHWEMF